MLTAYRYAYPLLTGVWPLTEQVQENKLSREYDALRQREFTVLTDLLEVLPKIDGLAPEYAAQARDALFHADNPYLMVLVGAFNAGKSSIINALLGEADVMTVGPVPTTDRITILRYGEAAQRIASGEADTVLYPAPILQRVSLVDTPGLESVFQKHESQTRKFLHRADTVLYVMLATQAMSAEGLQALNQLRDYGKKVILIINQIDLISPEDRETVKRYVSEQAKQHLSVDVPVWLMSAKQGLAANLADDAEGWKASGMVQIEEYVTRQLDDAERLRQKLLTPLQIAETACAQAVHRVKDNQAAMDASTALAENVRGQLSMHERDLKAITREVLTEAGSKFDAVAQNGSQAIRDLYQLSDVPGMLLGGFVELFPFLRKWHGEMRRVAQAFANHKVYEPLTELPQVVDKLAPRLEGRDLKDLDELATYTTREIKQLPEAIRQKIIGTPQAPVTYDRRALQEVRPVLMSLEEQTRAIEVQSFAASSRQVLIGLLLWEVVLLVLGVAALSSGALGESTWAVLLFLVVLAMLGVVVMPVLGRVMGARYATAIYAQRKHYLDKLSAAADAQMEYGMRLRKDIVAPLTRLVDAQASLQREMLGRLHNIETEIGRLSNDVNKLGRKGFLGLGR
jgi:small GTP-binding protein